MIESLQHAGAANLKPNAPEERLLVEEAMRGCMTGMLLCLDRRERIALILSTVFGASSALGAQLLEVGPDNYRQIVSRGRKRLANFMNERCGLLNKENRCRCSMMAPRAVAVGLVDPARARFDLPYIRSIREFVTEKGPLIDIAVELKLQNLLRDQPMYNSPDFKRLITVMLRRKDIGEIVNFGQEENDEDDRDSWFHRTAVRCRLQDEHGAPRGRQPKRLAKSADRRGRHRVQKEGGRQVD